MGQFFIAFGPSTRFAEADVELGIGDASPNYSGFVSLGLRGRLYPISRPQLGQFTISPYLAGGLSAGMELGEVDGTGKPESVLYGDVCIGIESGFKADEYQGVLFFEIGAAGVNGGGNDLPPNLRGTDAARIGRGGLRIRLP